MQRFLHLQFILLYSLLSILCTVNISYSAPLPEYIKFSTKQYFFWEGAYRPAIALWLTPDQDYYLYANSEVASGKPTTITVLQGETVIEGVDILYPVGTKRKDIQDPTKTIQAYETSTPIVIILPKDTVLDKINIRTEGLLCTVGRCIPVRAIANIVVEDPSRLTNIRKTRWFYLLQPALNALLEKESYRRTDIFSAIPTKKVLSTATPKKETPKKVVPKKATLKKAVPKTIKPKTVVPKPIAPKAVITRPVMPKKVVSKNIVPNHTVSKNIIAKNIAPKRIAPYKTPPTAQDTTKPTVSSTTKPTVVWYRGSGDEPKTAQKHTSSLYKRPLIYSKSPPTEKRPSLKSTINPTLRIRQNKAQRLWDFTPRYVQSAFEVTSLTKALIFAFIAGFILNFMPCVFPILTLKFSSFIAFIAKKEDEDRNLQQKYNLDPMSAKYNKLLPEEKKKVLINPYNATLSAFRKYNIFFCLGIITFFGLLGAFLHITGSIWGRLFQLPEVMLVIACIIFALALSIFDVFTLPILSLGIKNNSASAPQAFFTGILTTLLATPCSAPLLGGVLSWLLLQSLNYYIIVLLVVALGMSLPYIIFIFFPRCLYLLPKPGKWNIVLSHIVGLFLVGTTIYILSLLPIKLLVSSLIILFIMTVMLWIWGTFTGVMYTMKRTLFIRFITLIIASFLVYWLLLPNATTKWIPFNPNYFTRQLGKKVLVLNFTADWCPNCKVLEKTVLTPNNLAEWQKKYKATFITADITHDNPQLQKLMQLLKSNSIPLLAIFPKGNMALSPIILRDLYTPKQVDQALRKATR